MLCIAILNYFGVRGTSDLEFSPIRHVCLEELVIVGAGLRKGIFEGLDQSVLPALTRLELWIGSEDCGFDGSIANFESLFSGELFPNLKHLALRNAENVDKIAKALKGAPILEQIESLDLSLGCLTDEGARHLLENPAINRLKMLDIHWHNLSSEILKEFAIMGPVSINASQPDYQTESIDQHNTSNNFRGGLYLEDYYHHQFNVVDWPY